MSKNKEIFTVTVNGMTNMGAGVAKSPEGKTLFVKGGVEGDEADVFVIKETSSYDIAAIETLKKASPYRTETDCGCYKACGGCVFRHVTYEKEKQIKLEHVKEAFRRYASLDIDVNTVETACVDRYRNNVRYPVEKGKDGKLFAGFFSEHSHRVVNVSDCITQKTAMTEVLAEIVKLLNENGLSAYDETSGKGYLRHICLRTNRYGKVSVCFVVNGKKMSESLANVSKAISDRFDNVTGVYVNYNAKNTNVIFGDVTENIIEKEKLTETLCGRTFSISPRSFFQVNTETAELLFERAGEYLGANENDVVIDLYCGTGTVGICTVDKKTKLYGCEIIPEAVSDAAVNAEENGMESFRFDCCDASEGIKRCKELFGDATAMTVDPPRKGLSPETVNAILESGIPKVVYISCNPDTLARDVKLLGEKYKLERISLFDMFPRTSHVETVVLMSRDKE